MTEQTRETLRTQANWLAFGHALSGLVIGALGLLFLGHVAVGVAVLGGWLPLDDTSPGMDWLFGGMFLVIGTLAVMGCELFAAVSLYAAYCFTTSRHRMFLIVVQAFNLMHQPIGTVLGVLGLVWLFQEDTKALFEENADPMV